VPAVSEAGGESELYLGWLTQCVSLALEIPISAVYQALCLKKRLLYLRGREPAQGADGGVPKGPTIATAVGLGGGRIIATQAAG
jgi:hypothetical protein